MPKSTEERIQEDAESYAFSLGITVDDLKNTKVSLYDIISARYDKEALDMFHNARSVFKVANYYVVRALLKK